MDSNPIKYSDLIKDDGAIDKAIQDLKDLESSYEEAAKAVKDGAKGMASELKKASVATDEGRESTENMSYEAKKLKQAYMELKLAMSETGRKIQELKTETKLYNQTHRDTYKLLKANEGSYTEMAARLKILTTGYKNVVSAQGVTSEAAKKLLGDIVALKTELKKHDDAMRVNIARVKEQSAQLTAEEKARERLKAAMSGEAVELAKLNKQVQEATRIAKLKAVIDTEQEGSYNRLSAQYALNKIELNKMTQAERETTEAGKKLVQETYEIYQSMIRLQEATGKHTLSVGNYKKHWDGLGVAINQVMREVPAAAISINTFFLGISNNIPMLIDEIQRLRVQNQLLAAEGKQQINITKQVIKSIFSLNTIMIAALTILAMYGDDILNWIGSLFRGEKATMSFTDALKQLNEELKNGVGAYGDNLVKYKELQKEWANLGSLKEREDWLKKNADAFRELDVECNNVLDAENFFINNTPSVINAFKDRAKAAAAMELAQKKYQEAFAKEEEARLRETAGPTVWDRLYAKAAGAATSSGGPSIATDYETTFANIVQGIRDESKELEAEGDMFFKMYQEYESKANSILGTASTTGKTKRGRQPKDATDYLDRTATDVQRKYMESLTDLERDELTKRRKEAVETYNSEVAALNDKFNKVKRILDNESNEYKELTDDQKEQAIATQNTIVKTIEQKQRQLNKTLEDIERDRQLQDLDILQQTLDLRLKAVKEGSEEELRLRLSSLEAQRRAAILQNAKLPKSQQVSEADINAGFKKAGIVATGEFNLSMFDQQQDLANAEFNIVRRTEYEITQLKLQQERDRWIKLIQLAEAGAIDKSATEIATMKATVEGLNNQLDMLEMETPLLQKLGFDSEQISTMKDAVSTVISYIQEIAQAEVDAAQAAVEAAQDRVDAAKEALDAEIEARNNGYANSVEAARKEYELEKQKQAQKEKLLAEAQKRQERLNTLTQASSLITASANIWSSFSILGPFGVGLALAAISTMWGSFMAAKIKANQLTQDTQEYGDGGLEFLEGGSHASGNDIDLGVNNSRKKRMKAEGGEALAIINKKQTSKYKKALPTIIDSLNKGVFEDKFTAVDAVDNTVNLIAAAPSVDLSRIEDDLSQIRKQGESSVYTLADGTVVEKKKGMVRTIKR